MVRDETQGDGYWISGIVKVKRINNLLRPCVIFIEYAKESKEERGTPS